MKETIHSSWRNCARSWGPATLFLLFLAACAGREVEKVPIDLKPPPRVIALTRVVFGEERPDASCDRESADIIRWRVRRELEDKGYRVVEAKLPPPENVNRAETLARAPVSTILGFLPEGAEALLRLHMERYLGFDLCPREAIATLEITVEAEMFAPGRSMPVWRSRATASTISTSRGDDPFFTVGARLGQELIAPLPSVP